MTILQQFSIGFELYHLGYKTKLLQLC